jgi:hypothetical protein
MNQTPPPERRRRGDRLDLDVRGILALISLMGSLLALSTLMVRSDIEGPVALAFLGTLAGPVMGFYFGAKGAAGSEQQYQQGVTQSAQGVQLAEIHALVNSRLESLTERLDKALSLLTADQRDELDSARAAARIVRDEQPPDSDGG